jgi:hypothetical protein
LLSLLSLLWVQKGVVGAPTMLWRMKYSRRLQKLGERLLLRFYSIFHQIGKIANTYQAFNALGKKELYIYIYIYRHTHIRENHDTFSVYCAL